MTVSEQMEKKGLTRYRLSKDSGIPYTTVNDICTGKAKLEKCSAETIYRLSKTLGVSMESLLEPCMTKRLDFELFKSNVCHRLKELGDKAFIVKLLQEDAIGTYAARKWFPEALYLLAMLDYTQLFTPAQILFLKSRWETPSLRPPELTPTLGAHISASCGGLTSQ